MFMFSIFMVENPGDGVSTGLFLCFIDFFQIIPGGLSYSSFLLSPRVCIYAQKSSHESKI